MTKLDEELYQYMTSHSQAITELWMGKRERQAGSIYSVDASHHTQEELRRQNTLTNKTVTSILTGDQQLYYEYLEEWSQIVAESRVNSETPVYEVLDALHKAREVYWQFVERFCGQEGTSAEAEDLMKWSRLIHGAFGDLTVTFTEMYAKLTEMRFAAQKELIHSLSAPVIPIADSIAVLPIIGDMDMDRAASMLETITEKCAEEGIDQLFVDLSGVTFMEVFFAEKLEQLEKSLSLIGTKTVFSGIRPEIAHFSVRLGLEFTLTDSYSTLKQALRRLDIER